MSYKSSLTMKLCSGLVCLFFFQFFFSCAEDDEKPAISQSIISSDDASSAPPFSPPEELPTSSRGAALADYQNYLAAAVEDNGWIGDAKDCDAGDIPMRARELARRRWDYYRRQVGFTRPLVLDESLSRKAQYTALIMEANETLTHKPTKELKCYTEKGEEYAHFNLAFAYPDAPITEMVPLLMKDEGAHNKSVGHRAWFLHPNVYRVAVAATDHYAAMGWRLEELREGAPDPALSDGLAFSSWPPEGYAVADLVYPRWSLHYFAQVEDEDISSAAISMVRKDDQQPVSLSVIHRGNTGKLGLRTIVWEPVVEKPADGADVGYVVRLSGFMVEGKERPIVYEVILIHADAR